MRLRIGARPSSCSKNATMQLKCTGTPPIGAPTYVTCSKGPFVLPHALHAKLRADSRAPWSPLSARASRCASAWAARTAMASLVRRVGFFGRCHVSLHVRQHRNQYLGLSFGSWMSKSETRNFGNTSARSASVKGASRLAQFAQLPERVTVGAAGLREAEAVHACPLDHVHDFALHLLEPAPQPIVAHQQSFLV
jgi:hypothetical protein